MPSGTFPLPLTTALEQKRGLEPRVGAIQPFQDRHGRWHDDLPAARRCVPARKVHRPHVANGRLRHILIGYARVSKTDGSQSLDLQRDALQTAGVDAVHVYHDVASGVRDDRRGLDSCLRALRTGDVLVVWKLDRLGRTLAHLVNTVQDLSTRGVGLRVLTGQGAQIDTTTAAGRLVFGIFAALAEFERELIDLRCGRAGRRGRCGSRSRRRSSDTARRRRPPLDLWLPDRIYGCNWFYEGQFTLLARRNVRSFRAVASAERCSVCVA